MRNIFAHVFFIAFSIFISGAFAEKFALDYPDDPVCVIKTSKGDIYVELFAQEAPKTVENFIGLAEGKKAFLDHQTKEEVTRPFYDNLIFHRVVKDLIIQGGCPVGNGSGTPGYKFEDEINADYVGLNRLKAITGNQINPILGMTQEGFQRFVVGPLVHKMGIKTQDELLKKLAEVKSIINNMSVKDCYENLGYTYDDSLKSHPPIRGALAMANRGPNTSGSQFFLALDNLPQLTGRHTVFGRIVHGMDVAKKIGQLKVNEKEMPLETVTIKEIRLYTGEKPSEGNEKVIDDTLETQ